MPNLQNAKKALRQSEKREELNRGHKNRVKKTRKEIDDLLEKGEVEKARNLLPTYYKYVDKAAKRNIYHKNNAARKKAAITKRVDSAAKTTS